MSKKVKSGRERSRTITRTFRIQQEWNDTLEDEAKKQGISVNVLVNKLLRRYALFNRWADSASFQSFPSQTFKGILEELSEESLAKAGATAGASDVPDILNMIGRPLNFESFKDLVLEHFGGSDSCRWYTCFHHIQGSQHVFHFQHNLGRKWSIYLEKYLLSGLSFIANIKAETKIYNFAVTLKVTSI